MSLHNFTEHSLQYLVQSVTYELIIYGCAANDSKV